MMTRHRRLSCHAFSWLLLGLFPLAGHGQAPEFQPLLSGHKIVCAQHAAGLLYAGLEHGGLVEWDPATARILRILTRREGMGGQFVADLAWIDGRLWVATRDGGLTVIDNPGSLNESMRVYTSQLSSLDVTAVAGQIAGGIERIYYGTNGQGVGIIRAGLPGDYYNTLDGLIDDTIEDLALSGSLLLVATPAGLSRFAENVFTSYPYVSPPTEWVYALEVGPGGAIWAATASGIKRWNDEERALQHVFGSTMFWDIAVDGETVWALGSGRVYRKQGDSGFEEQDLPFVPEGLQVSAWALAAGNGSAWFGGQQHYPDLVGSGVGQAWLAAVGDAAAIRHLLPTCQLGSPGGFGGAAIDSRGRPWLGDYLGRGLAGYDDAAWYNVTHLGTEENDFNGLFAYGHNILVMARAGGDLWFNQTGKGVIRFRPALQQGGEEVWSQIEPDNSGMQGRSFVAIGAHPDGPVFFCTDLNDADLGVDVLIDPDSWHLESSWLHIGRGLLGGDDVWAVGFERRDVVWFAVRGVGLQRWDINGPHAGPEDPLTWDTSAANWLPQPLNLLSGSNVALEGSNAIIKGPDGSLWAGGTGGLVNFRFNPPQAAVRLNEWTQKTQPLVPGLLASGVTGLALDRNDHLWVMTSGGLNRLRLGIDPLIIDAYTDVATFLAFEPGLYSSGIIAALPGPDYRHLAASSDRSRLVLSSTRGGALVTIPTASSGGDDLEAALAAAYLYPNPFPGDTAEPGLNLGGLSLEDGQQLSLEVLNLAGQVVYQTHDVHGMTRVWDGRNRQGRRVASGLYVIKLTVADRSAIKTLAVLY